MTDEKFLRLRDENIKLRAELDRTKKVIDRFPKMTDRSHEFFTLNDYKNDGIEYIRTGFFDAYMYIWDIIEWVEELRGCLNTK